MSKSTKERSTSPAAPVSAATSSRQSGNPVGENADAVSKQSHVIAMLQSPTGTTIAAIMKATGWQQHSVRGFLAGVVRKRLKLKLSSNKVGGTRVYQIASADGGKPASGRSKRRSS